MSEQQSSPSQPQVQQPSLMETKDMSERELQEANAQSLDSMDSALWRIVQCLETRTPSEPTTATPESAETPRTPDSKPLSEVAVSAVNDVIYLADGRTASADAVRALTEYDNTWPGCVIPEARAVVTYVVTKSIEENQEPVLRTNYAFCLEPNPIEGDSPCILHASHGQRKHQDNNDGVW